MDLETNDLLITNGDLSIVDGTDAIAQDLQQTLQVWLGEWFLNTAVGIPFKQQILVKNPIIDLVQADIINAAKNVPGITEIQEIAMEYDNANRAITMSIVALDSNGEVIKAQVPVSLPANQTIQGTVFG